MTLYEIPQEYMVLQDMADDQKITVEELSAAMKKLDDVLSNKLSAWAKVVANLDADLEILDKEIMRLQERKKNKAAKKKQMIEDMAEAMAAMDKKKVETELFTFRLKTTPEALVIDVAEDIPTEFYDPADAKLNKSRLKQFLKNSVVEYAHLERGRSLAIS